MIQNTVRMWTIAFIFTTIGSGINMLLSLRRPSIVITSIVAQLLSFPIGKAWDRYMPALQFNIFGRTIHLNPCPFNIKEHTLIIVSPPLSHSN
jgi:OPT oligopeptide transporter protein